MLLSDPEPEIINEDAEAVVACLYDFIHAVGMGDMERAMSCVAEDYHTIEEDQEIDRQGLERQIKTILDSLHGWEYDVSLAEIPQPILHPRAILIYTEIQIDATKAGGKERRATLYRRIAVFRQQPDKSWLITALSPVSRGK